MTKEEAYKTLKENLCAMCAYGSQNMESCNIRSCDNRDAIKVLEQEKPETVTEFADRCRECGAKYGKEIQKMLGIPKEKLDEYEDLYWYFMKKNFGIDLCSDAIGRQAVIDTIYAECSGAKLDIDFAKVLMLQRAIKALPPVTPQSKTDWIPVSEKLPKENKTVIASTDYCVYPEARYTEKCGWEGAYESGADYWVKIKDIIAWMPFPKHYELQESEDKK